MKAESIISQAGNNRYRNTIYYRYLFCMRRLIYIAALTAG